MRKPPSLYKIDRRNARNKKTRSPGYEVNNHWNICDLCGCAIRNKDTRKMWDGKVVCPDDWDYRQPQDFVRGQKDDTRPVGLHRPEPADVVITPQTSCPEITIDLVDPFDIATFQLSYITVTGNNFTGVTLVTVSDFACTDVVVVSNTELTATIPTGGPTGYLTIKLETPAGCSGELADALFAIDTPP